MHGQVRMATAAIAAFTEERLSEAETAARCNALCHNTLIIVVLYGIGTAISLALCTRLVCFFQLMTVTR